MTGLSPTEVFTIDVDGQVLRVGIRRGSGTPLLVFNGIGANLEILAPFTQALEGVETIVFDVPGTGGSALPSSPYCLRGLALLADRMLTQLGYTTKVDVLGLSWGGALAQEFARSCSQRCRRLILAATTPGALMVPGSPLVLWHMFNPRRYGDPDHLRKIAPRIYGGDIRSDPANIKAHILLMQRPHWLGYAYQQLAFLGWSSLRWLPRLRQPTLVLAGRLDPLVPLLNARVLARLIPHARLEVVEDGHLFLLSSPHRVAAKIRHFLLAPSPAV